LVTGELEQVLIQLGGDSPFRPALAATVITASR
jgi:hypothetical protein